MPRRIVTRQAEFLLLSFFLFLSLSLFFPYPAFPSSSPIVFFLVFGYYTRCVQTRKRFRVFITRNLDPTCSNFKKRNFLKFIVVLPYFMLPFPYTIDWNSTVRRSVPVSIHKILRHNTTIWSWREAKNFLQSTPCARLNGLDALRGALAAAGLQTYRCWTRTRSHLSGWDKTASVVFKA